MMEKEVRQQRRVQQGSQGSTGQQRQGQAGSVFGSGLPEFRPASPVSPLLMQMLRSLSLDKDWERLAGESPVGHQARQGLSLSAPNQASVQSMSGPPVLGDRVSRERYVEGFYQLVTQPKVFVSQYGDNPEVYRKIMEQIRPQWERRIGFQLTDEEFEQVVQRALKARLLWKDAKQPEVLTPGQWVYYQGYSFQVPGDETAKDLPARVWMRQAEWSDAERRQRHLEEAKRQERERRKSAVRERSSKSDTRNK